MKLDAILKMEAGPELNALVGKTFGFKSTFEWLTTKDDGKSYCLSFTMWHEANGWWQENKLDTYDPNHRLYGYKLIEVEIWPDFSRDYNAAFSALNKSGFKFVLRMVGIHYHFIVARKSITNGSPTFVVGDSIPLIMCKGLVVATLRERGELEE